MRLILASCLGAVLLVADLGTAADHVVSSQAAETRLLQAVEARQQDQAAVEAALSSPPAVQAAALVGADLARVRAAVPTLSDAELGDLAARASALRNDPVAGLDPDIKLLLEIFLIVAIVILVLRALD